MFLLVLIFFFSFNSLTLTSFFKRLSSPIIYCYSLTQLCSWLQSEINWYFILQRTNWNYSHSLPPIHSNCYNQTAKTRWLGTIDLDVHCHRKCPLSVLSQRELFLYLYTEGTNTFHEYPDSLLDKSSHVISSNTIILENRTQCLNFVEMQSCVW